MSSEQSSTDVNSSTSSATHSGQPRLRVWPTVIVLALFWAFIYVHYNIELGMTSRFFSRFIAHALLLVFFLGWWLTRRAVPWRDRWRVVGFLIITTLVAGLLSHPTVGIFGLWFASMPILLTAAIAWLIISRIAPPGIRRAGFIILVVSILGYFDLLRMTGLWGGQHAEYAWRWTPSPEELLLKSRRDGGANRRGPGASVAWTAGPSDWTEFRGPNRDAVLTDIWLPADWKSNPLRLAWRERVGPGWSSLIVVAGHILTQEQRGEMEAVTCYNATTGKEVWIHEDQARFEESLSGAGPRSTPTFAGGRIYTQGATGLVNCLDAATGKKIWSHDLAAENGAKPPIWGISSSPLAVDRLIVAYAGGPEDKDLVAYDALSGELRWSAAAGEESYSSPQVSTIDGVRQAVMHDNEAVRGFRIEDGTLLWMHPNSGMTVPMLQPYVLDGNRLLIAAGQGLALVEIRQEGDNWSTTLVWETHFLKPSFNGFAVHEGHVFGLDDGILCCIDLATGKRQWKRGRYGFGQVMLVKDQNALLVLGEKGELALVAANPQEYEELTRMPAIDGKTWNIPVISDGRLFLRNGEEMACFELPAERAK